MFSSSLRSILLKGCTTIFLISASVTANNGTNTSAPCPSKISSNGTGQSTLPSNTSDSHNHSFCDSGNLQSPINVDVPSCKTRDYSPVVFKDDLLFTNEIEFENNGKTAEIHLVDKTIEPKVEGGPLGNTTYIICNVHFHWGHKKTEGCEHTISGRHFPMETHVVLRKSSFKTLQEALDGGGVAVLGFLYSNAQVENSALNPLLTDIVKVKLPHSKCSGSGSVLSYLKDYVSGGFYSYTGSLTTGFCTEGVLWTLYKKSIPIAITQLDYFHQIEDEHGLELSNWRKLKPLNNREVCMSSF